MLAFILGAGDFYFSELCSQLCHAAWAGHATPQPIHKAVITLCVLLCAFPFVSFWDPCSVSSLIQNTIILFRSIIELLPLCMLISLFHVPTLWYPCDLWSVIEFCKIPLKCCFYVLNQRDEFMCALLVLRKAPELENAVRVLKLDDPSIYRLIFHMVELYKLINKEIIPIYDYNCL